MASLRVNLKPAISTKGSKKRTMCPGIDSVDPNDKGQVVNFPGPEDDRARRLRALVEWRAGQPPIEWELYLEDDAKKHEIEPAELRRLIQAVIKERKKKAREERDIQTKHERKRERDQEKAERKKTEEEKREERKEREERRERREEAAEQRRERREAERRERALATIMTMPAEEREAALRSLAI